MGGVEIRIQYNSPPQLSRDPARTEGARDKAIHDQVLPFPTIPGRQHPAPSRRYGSVPAQPASKITPTSDAKAA